MTIYLIDAYRPTRSSRSNCIVLWCKQGEKNIRIEKPFSTTIYVEPTKEAAKYLKAKRFPLKIATKRTYLRKPKLVYQIDIDNLNSFEHTVSGIERGTSHHIPIYNGDTPPEQLYLNLNNLTPCAPYNKETNTTIDEELYPSLSILKLTISGKNHIDLIQFNDEDFCGTEKEILLKFKDAFTKLDPDIIAIECAYAKLPFLVDRLIQHNLNCEFHRFDPKPIRYKGGRSFYSYGQVRYRDYGIKLNGRFLIDTSTMVGSSCDPEAIMELTRLSGVRFQTVVSRSWGAIFQGRLVRLLNQEDVLIPLKEKPIDKPLNMTQLLQSDRAGHTFDPKIGFHQNVAEIDFASMYPWLIYNHNISADTILTDEGPFEKVPNIPVKVSRKYKGYVPRAIKPILDRRMEYKRNPTRLNKIRAKGLKWVLVTCYGYLRFREFKLGLPSSHMAICSYARETILNAAKIAEEKGFEVIHGIVDCLWVTKPGMNEEDVEDLRAEIEHVSGIPASSDGIFKWVTFLPSIEDSERPIRARYYGIFKDGSIKARGIEVRQRSSPKIIQHFQSQVLNLMGACNTEEEILNLAPQLGKLMRTYIMNLDKCDAKELQCRVCISKTQYKHNIPQKYIVDQLRKKGLNPQPGHNVRFVFSDDGVILPEDYNGKPDIEAYTKFFVRALYIVLQPFGISKEYVQDLALKTRQTKIEEYLPKVYKETTISFLHE